MEKWLKISLLLCLVGFFKGMMPSDHFLFQYLTQFRHVSQEIVINTFYPQVTYFTAGFLIISLLLTDILRYKPVIVLSILAGTSIYATLRWCEGYNTLIVSTFSAGLMNATEIAYFTYIYAKVDRAKYQQVTSNTRSALLLGKTSGAFLAQLLMMFQVLNPLELIYISFGNKCIAMVIALFLPSVTTSIYFYQANKKEATHSLAITNSSSTVDNKPSHIHDGSGDQQELVKFSWTNAKNLLVSHFRSAYSNKNVRLWSIWWILLEMGYNIMFLYLQPLWHFIEPDREDMYNGFAEAGLFLCGAVGAMMASKLSPPLMEKWAIWIVVSCSIGMGSFSIIAALTTNVFVSYAMCIALGGLYFFMLTVANAIVAKNLVQDSFGMIFGLNVWISSVLLFIFNLVVVSDAFFSFNPRQLYTIFGCYFFALVLIFTAFGLFKGVQEKRVKSV